MSRYQAGEYLPYFCTITVLDWTPILIEARYVDPIIESLEFSRAHKGLQLFAFVVMPNHLHLIATANDLHANPVRKGLVATPEDWWYSSAAWYARRKQACMQMDAIEL